MVEVAGVCEVLIETGEILCTMSMASVGAVVTLGLMGFAIQLYSVAEDWKK